MKLTAAQNIAETLMSQHGLLQIGWKFSFDRATSRLGACHYGKKMITLSRHMCEAADYETVQQTMLHEIAHAMLPLYKENGKAVGHGPMWKKLAQQIGYRGERTAVNPYLAAKKPAPKQRKTQTKRQAPRVAKRYQLPAGTLVRIQVSPSSKYNNVIGVIERVNSKTYSVHLRSGEKLYAPHAAVVHA